MLVFSSCGSYYLGSRKTKILISLWCSTADLPLVFAYTKSRFSNDMAHSGFPTRSDTNRAVQQQKMTRDLKFRIKEVGELYYLCSENKGADQLRGYREADLPLCFRICKTPVFS